MKKKRLAMLGTAIAMWFIGSLWWVEQPFDYAVPITYPIAVFCLFTMATRWQIFDSAITRVFASVAYVSFSFWPTASITLSLRSGPVFINDSNYTVGYATAIAAFGFIMFVVGAWALSMILAIRVWKVQE